MNMSAIYVKVIGDIHITIPDVDVCTPHIYA